MGCRDDRKGRHGSGTTCWWPSSTSDLGPVPQNFPLSVVLANLTTSFGGGWQYLTAAAFVSMIVPIIVFLSLQRYFVRGITGGAVKG